MTDGPLAIAIEYHTFGAPLVDGVVQTSHASLYFSKGVPGDSIYGVHDYEKPGVQYVRIAERIALKDAEELMRIVIEGFSQKGITVESGTFYDE